MDVCDLGALMSVVQVIVCNLDTPNVYLLRNMFLKSHLYTRGNRKLWLVT